MTFKRNVQTHAASFVVCWEQSGSPTEACVRLGKRFRGMCPDRVRALGAYYKSAGVKLKDLDLSSLPEWRADWPETSKQQFLYQLEGLIEDGPLDIRKKTVSACLAVVRRIPPDMFDDFEDHFLTACGFLLAFSEGSVEDCPAALRPYLFKK